MANLLIGSSNVNRHYRASDFPNVRQYKAVKCTQFSGFSAYMVSLAPNCQSVLISVVENFIVDAVGADVVGPENAIDGCIKDFLTVILKSALKLPNARFGIVLPLRRPAIQWYEERIDAINKFIGEGIRAMISDKNVNNVVTINCSPGTTQQFEADLVHLTKPSTKIFLETILDSAERFFRAEVVDLNESGEISEGSPNTDQLKLLEDRLARLERTIQVQADKNVANDLMFARSREETDANTNKIKEDRLVMNGLKSSTPLPSDPRVKIEALKKLALEIFESLIPNFQGKIIYLSQGKVQGEPIPMVEVRLDKPEFAIAVRKAYADKRKNKQLSRDLESLFISNSVSLATRVRVDVMKAIARKITNAQDLAYVAGFTSRPMMHIRKAGPPSPTMRPLKSFSYIDTVSRYGHLVDVEDLETAYGRAGKSFNGQLQQNFVVLNERDQAALQSVSGTASSSTSSAAGTSFGKGARGGGARSGYPAGPGATRSRGEKRSGTPIENTKSKK
jgi:hypothetical protein